MGGIASYPLDMADATEATDIRRLRVPARVWDAYTDLTGDLGRAQDLRDYIEWRIDHPDTPLPGKKWGPIRRWREKTKAERLANGLPI